MTMIISIKDTYLTISSYPNYCQNHYSKEILTKIKELEGKRILSINNLDPLIYLEEIGKNGISPHSPQCKFISALDNTKEHSLYLYPHKKEDLLISMKFEGDKLLETEYAFEQYKFSSNEFKEFFLEEQMKSFKNRNPIPKYEEIEKKFKIKKGLINKLTDEKDIWDLKSEDETIKCRVDLENNFNVLYQSSFSPKNFNNYENIMYECLSKFYSNDFKIIIIESRNGGGYTELCGPLTQYIQPKIYTPLIFSMKSTNLISTNFF